MSRLPIDAYPGRQSRVTRPRHHEPSDTRIQDGRIELPATPAPKALLIRHTASSICAAALCALVACGGGISTDTIAPTPPFVAAVVAPCSDGYGTAEDRAAIEQAMLSGTTIDVHSAIAAAHRTRDLRLGCPEVDVTRDTPNTAVPPISDVLGHWNAIHAPAIARYQIGCPEIGRGAPSAALGAWVANRAGASVSTNALSDIARMLEAQQFTAARAALVVDTTFGVYGGVVAAGSSDACSLTGTAGNQVSTWCSRFPEQCPQYASGLFAGRRFLVADINRAAGVLDGGAAFDQGWSGVMMIEAAMGVPDLNLRKQFAASARLAGAWAAAEPPVRNHNYTAKNIWLLARLYGWSGETMYRDVFIDKLERNLLLGVLTDENADGLTDTPGPQVAFAKLVPVARLPGRMWDAHNSVTHYQAMNTVAMVEAYVALRDRGETLSAARAQNYALAMLDNLAYEFTELGVPSAGASQREAGFALALGLWKIAQVENLAKPAWDRALAAIFNAGASKSAGAGTAFAGVYLAARTRALY
jgi:hypothetical protein